MPDIPTPDEILIYKRLKQIELGLHTSFPANHTPADQRAALVFFFGGGWNNGTPAQFYPHCRYFAGRGMVAMAAEYRVHSRHHTSPRECVQDGKSALRWVRRHATELGINPGNLIAGGGSAGGHVAAATATLSNFNEPGEDQGIDCRPGALVLFNPVFDNGPNGYGYKRVRDYWQAFSPLHNINRNTPPTVVFLGDQDHLIPVATAKAYQTRMVEFGRRCDLHIYPGQGHGFFNARHPEYYQQTVAAADAFLVSLGYLPPPQTENNQHHHPGKN